MPGRSWFAAVFVWRVVAHALVTQINGMHVNSVEHARLRLSLARMPL